MSQNKISETKRKCWMQRISRFQESNQTIRDFCKAEQIVPSTLSYWLKKSKVQTIKPLASPGFLPVIISDAAPGYSSSQSSAKSVPQLIGKCVLGKKCQIELYSLDAMAVALNLLARS
jgi:hypothetical protein